MRIVTYLFLLVAIAGCSTTQVVTPTSFGGDPGSLIVRNELNEETQFLVNPCKNRDVIIDVGNGDKPVKLAPGASHETSISPGCYWVTYVRTSNPMGGVFHTVEILSGEEKTQALDDPQA